MWPWPTLELLVVQHVRVRLVSMGLLHGSGANHGWLWVAGTVGLGSSTRMTTFLGGVVCLLGDVCLLGVVALPLQGCSFKLARRLVAVTIMSP